jgi:GrpB-like predicted nucleotidyltransferase (UPF0157 family)
VRGLPPYKTPMALADHRAAAAIDLQRAGEADAAVQVVDYDPQWPAAFEAERRRLAPLLGGAAVQHIGSTAVPGLAAKPVIDMMAHVPDMDALITALIERAGYQFPRAYNATLSHRRFLCYPGASHRTHHLHLVDEEHELGRRLRFRDRLRADPVLAREYATLKRSVAGRFAKDREAYNEAKHQFIHTNSGRPENPLDHSQAADRTVGHVPTSAPRRS